MTDSGSARGLRDQVGVLIAAAGRGERAGPGEPKQFREVAGVPLLLRALRPFTSHPSIARVVVALPPEVAGLPPRWLADLAGDRLALVVGGAVRAASVRAALKALDDHCAIVLVHDAARPFVSRSTIDSVIDTAAEGVAAVPGIPVGETLKRTVDGGARVAETINRERLWRAQTPQGFPRRILEDAFRRAGDHLERFTDEAALVEATGAEVRIVPGEVSNIKMTTVEDLQLAEALLRS